MRTLGHADILFILAATQWTLLLSIVAFAGGGIGGIIIAFGRISERRWLLFGAIAYIKIFQGTPLLLQLFLAYFVPSVFGINPSPWTAAAVGLSLNTSAFLGEIWRGSIETVPRGQWESASALGLRYTQRMILIIIPQAYRIAIPPTIGFLVQLIKATSLASILGFVEITRAAQIINNATFRPFTIFSVVAAVYFAVCWPLSIWSRNMEKRLSVATP
jgi:polar amino acid transport system permease protein